MTATLSCQDWQQLKSRLVPLLGDAGFGQEADFGVYSVDGRVPGLVLFPDSIPQVAEILRFARAHSVTVLPAGNGNHLRVGGLLQQDYLILSLVRLNRVVDYRPENMTLTLQAGVTLVDAQRYIGEKGQWLPIDPPQASKTTIGGLIAANLSGPMRLSQGTVRDLLIGVKIINADGAVIQGGGRVVKNVAGYDLPKLYCGSFGTLGVIVEASFKVRPKPEEERLVCIACVSMERALELACKIRDSDLEPLFLEVTNFAPSPKTEKAHRNSHLITAFAGVKDDVEYQRARLPQHLRDGLDRLVDYGNGTEPDIKSLLRDFSVAGDALLRLRASLPPSHIEAFIKEIETEAADKNLALHLLARAGSGIVYSRFQDPSAAFELLALQRMVEKLRVSSENLGGNLVVEEIEPSLKAGVDVWGNPGKSLRLMKSIKEQLDPSALLGGGRFVGGI